MAVSEALQDLLHLVTVPATTCVLVFERGQHISGILILLVLSGCACSAASRAWMRRAVRQARLNELCDLDDIHGCALCIHPTSMPRSPPLVRVACHRTCTSTAVSVTQGSARALRPCSRAHAHLRPTSSSAEAFLGRASASRNSSPHDCSCVCVCVCVCVCSFRGLHVCMCVREGLSSSLCA